MMFQRSLKEVTTMRSTQRRRSLFMARVLPAVAVLLAFSVALPAQTAQAATYTEEIIQSGPIQITSVLSSTMSSLEPWYESGWQIGIDPTQPVSGDIHFGLGLVSDPVLAQGMTLEVWACSVRWVNRACSTGYTSWMQPIDLAQGISVTNPDMQTHEVNAWSTDAPVWLVLRITTDNALRSDANAQFDITVWGEGFFASLDDNPSKLALTGAAFGTGLWLAVLTIGLGLPSLIPALARRRQNRRNRAQRIQFSAFGGDYA